MTNLCSISVIQCAKLVQTEDKTKCACTFLLLRCRLIYLKLVQTEDNTKCACTFLLLRCRLICLKLVQGERKTKKTFGFSEPQPNLAKQN